MFAKVARQETLGWLVGWLVEIITKHCIVKFQCLAGTHVSEYLSTERTVPLVIIIIIILVIHFINFNHQQVI